jgi:hypothetical protein
MMWTTGIFLLIDNRMHLVQLKIKKIEVEKL